MNEDQVKILLKKDLNFTDTDIASLKIFEEMLLKYNKKYNLISKSTEKSVWLRHILDSAQLLKYFNTDIKANLADLGSGAGFPGIVIAILNKNPEFHVKLYEKSPVKRGFLTAVKDKLNIQLNVFGNVQENKIVADIVVSRAFKKLDQIMKISRETIAKPHKMIILKGKNAQEEINNVSLGSNCSYKLESSITDADSKIVIIKVK